MNRHVVAFFSPASNTKHADDLAAFQTVNPQVTEVRHFESVAPLKDLLKNKDERQNVVAVVAKAGTEGTDSGYNLLTETARVHPMIFTCLYSNTISNDAAARAQAKEGHGHHMVSHCVPHIIEALTIVTDMAPRSERLAVSKSEAEKAGTHLTCPVCGLERLSSLGLYQHMGLFHMNVASTGYDCPICGPIGGQHIHKHIQTTHAPPGTPRDTSRDENQLYSFGLSVIRRKSDGKFLVVQEKRSEGFWLPGGGIDAGEFPWKAAERESVEEVGVAVKLTGLLRVEVNPSRRHRQVRMRYIFYGEPVDEEAAKNFKTKPDFESVGACWVSVDELKNGKVPQRGSEPIEWFSYVEKGGTIHPLNILGVEGEEPPAF